MELPKGAAAMVPNGWASLGGDGRAPVGMTGCVGRKGARCALTPMGPMPGPPPPWGMQKVLWRLRWHTSAPMCPGDVRPTWAFMLAPSMYTWPPLSWMTLQMRSTPSSYTPNVEGYVTMSAARWSLCSSARALSSSKLMLPFLSVPTATIL